MPCKTYKKRLVRKQKNVKPGVNWTVHYRYRRGKTIKQAICGTKRPYANTHLLSVITCKKCKKVIRGMLRG